MATSDVASRCRRSWRILFSHLLILFLLLFPLSSWGQAPGDGNPSCRTGVSTRNNHIFPEEWVVLMDTYDYFNLFDESAFAAFDAVWTARNFDGSAMGFNPNIGGLCTRSISASAASGVSNTNSWLFSQYISYEEAIQVFFNVSYTFSGCFSPCKPYFTLYRYDRDGMASAEERTDRSNYRPFFGTEENSRLDTSGAFVMETLDFARPSAFKGFYMAIRNSGTSVGMVNRIILYYRVSRGRTDPLTVCPDVPLPVVGSGQMSSMSCTCLGNSSEPSAGALVRSCDQNGNCVGGASCECNAGFRFFNSSMCVVCPEETYKAVVSNSVKCEACPMLSEARDPGTTICTCVPPNTRADDEGPEVECRDMSFPTSSAVAITFFVTFIIVGVAGLVGGFLAAYFWMKRSSK